MKKIKKFFASPLGTGLLFVLAAALLIAGGFGSTRAALTAFSENRVYEVELKDIGITLKENGEAVDPEQHKLLEKLTADGEDVKVGVEYPEVIEIENSGTIEAYVRVTIYRYWIDKDGVKDTELSPDFIQLNFTGDNWLLDPDASTTERLVLYYGKLLEVGETTTPLTDLFRVDPAINDEVTITADKKGEFTVLTRAYDYDGYQFVVEIHADGIQTHNAETAIRSAWGRQVEIANGVLNLPREGQ